MEDRTQPDLRIGRRDSADHVSVRVLGRMHDAADYWDGNWLVTPIEVSAGRFRATVPAALRAEELAGFRQELEAIDRTTKGSARLVSIEDWIDLAVEITPLGALEVQGWVRDTPGVGNRLSFRLDADLHLADIAPMVKELRTIESRFPVQGKPDDPGPPRDIAQR